MVAAHPALLKVRQWAGGCGRLPQRGAEEASLFVQGQQLEAMLDVRAEADVVEAVVSAQGA